jgi:amidase
MHSRRDFIKVTALASLPLSLEYAGHAQTNQATEHAKAPNRGLEEATIAELQVAISSGKETAVSLTKKYLRRIKELDESGPTLKAVIELNPDALRIAHELDQERKQKGPRGKLHGIPVLIKDNIATHDRMTTTAGSLALAGSIAPQDSSVAQKLREAGAVILGKSNLSEWANYRGDRSSSGWSGRGGQTKNPYALDRNPSGSSSGSAAAVAASLCAVAVGTETDGSIISPSAVCGIVGIKPTVGLVSRSGIIPISRSQDTAGPMARTVMDAAILLGALAGTDPRDEATQSNNVAAGFDYTSSLDVDGLKGARIGVPTRYFRNRSLATEALRKARDDMKELGASLVEFDENISNAGDAEGTVLSYEFKAGINEYLAWLGPDAPMRSLQDLIDFNSRNKDRELAFFGQEQFEKAQARGPLTEKTYLDALERCRRRSRAEGIDAVMDKYHLDAILGPSGGPAGTTDAVYGDRDVGGSSSPAAVAGYPNITVPAGHVMGLPVGISFFGRAYSEAALLKIAFAYEQGTKHRRAPKLLDTIG